MTENSDNERCDCESCQALEPSRTKVGKAIQELISVGHKEMTVDQAFFWTNLHLVVSSVGSNDPYRLTAGASAGHAVASYLDSLHARSDMAMLDNALQEGLYALGTQKSCSDNPDLLGATLADIFKKSGGDIH